MKTCTKCLVEMPLERFSALKHTRDGKQSWCKSCRAAYARRTHADTWPARREQKAAYRRANRAKRREYNRMWAAANLDRVRQQKRLSESRRRARIAGNLTLDFTETQLLARLSMWAGCWCCGQVPDQIDHVKPIAKGGAHILANLRPICGFCNQSKRDHWPLAA